MKFINENIDKKREETEYSDKQINIAKLEKTIKLFFSRYKPPCDVDVDEFFARYRRYVIIPGKIEYLATMSPNDLIDILKTIDWKL